MKQNLIVVYTFAAQIRLQILEGGSMFSAFFSLFHDSGTVKILDIH